MFVCTWFQGWPLGIGEWITELIFKEDYPFSGVINYFSSSSRLGVPQDFPYAIWHVNWYYHWLSLVCVASLSFPEDTISQKLSWSSGSSNPCSLSFMMYPKSWLYKGLCYRCTNWSWVPQLFVLCILANCCFLWWSLSAARKEPLWWELRPTLIYGFNDKCLKCR